MSVTPVPAGAILSLIPSRQGMRNESLLDITAPCHEPITVPYFAVSLRYDPVRSHRLSRFVDAFCVRAPAKLYLHVL